MGNTDIGPYDREAYVSVYTGNGIININITEYDLRLVIIIGCATYSRRYT
jgi:hypothetical protein